MAATIGVQTGRGGGGASLLAQLAKSVSSSRACAPPLHSGQSEHPKFLSLVTTAAPRRSHCCLKFMAVSSLLSPAAGQVSRKSASASLGEFEVSGGEVEDEIQLLGTSAEVGDVPLDGSVFEPSFSSVPKMKKVSGARVRGVPIPRSTLVPDDWRAVQAYQERGKKERKTERREVELEWARRMAQQRREARSSNRSTPEVSLGGDTADLQTGHDDVSGDETEDENWASSEIEDETKPASVGRAQPKDFRAGLEFSNFDDIARSLKDIDVESQQVEPSQVETQRNAEDGSEEVTEQAKKASITLTPEEKAMLKAKNLDFARLSSTCWSPLQTFAASGQVYLAAELLRKGVDVDGVDGDGLTALQRAVQAGRKTMVRMLLKAGANHVVVDGAGASLLHYSARLGNDEICKLLLRNGVDINAADVDGWTALHVAVQSGRLELVKALVYRGADITLETNDGCTALDLALAFGGSFNFYDTIKFLKKRMVFDVESRPQIETTDHST